MGIVLGLRLGFRAVKYRDWRLVSQGNGMTEWRLSVAILSSLAILTTFLVPVDIALETASAYSSHAPIFIVGDDDFTAENGVTGGTGTASDPYIIEGWEVDGENGRSCIAVSDTNSHLVIRDCSLWNASTHTIPYGHGIHLDGVSNCTIEGNSVLECYTGMFLEGSSNNTISGNIIHNVTHMGLQLYSSCSDNMICGNEIHSISYDSICVWSGSDRNMITDNWLHNNTFDGVDLRRSNGNIVTLNLIENCGSFGVSCAYAIPSNDTLISGNLIRQCNYGASLTGWRNTLYANAFWECPQGVRLLLGEEQNVVQNDLNSCGGICLDSANNSFVYGNNCSFSSNMWFMFGNQSGAIALYSSSANLILNNKLYKNYVYGVAINAGSELNIVNGCNFVENNGAQSNFDSENVQAFDDGDGNRWDEGGRGNHWSDWTEPDDNADGVVDNPYVIDGTAAENDNFPLTDPVSVGRAFLETDVLISGVKGEGGWYVSPVEIRFTIDSDWGWAENTYFRIDGTNWQTYSSPIQVNMEGTHTLEFHSEDILGNIEGVQAVDIDIDCSAPSLTLITENNTLFETCNVSISWMCADSCSGIDRVEYSLDGGPFALSEDSSGTLLSELGNGIHQLVVLAYDKAGNTVSNELTFEVAIASDDSGDDNADTSNGGDPDWPVVVAVATIVAIASAVAAIAIHRRHKRPPQD